MSEQTKTIVIGLVFVLIMCVGSYIAGRVKGREIGWDGGYAEGFAVGYATPHPSDTSSVVDTSHYDHPEPVDVKPAPPSGNGRERLLLGTIAELQARLDSLAAAKPDTAFVEIPVPIEVKTYGGEEGDDFEAQVSGYRPSLDWIEVYQKTTTITQYVEKPTHYKWTLSTFAEGGATLYRFDVRAGLEYERQIAGPLRGAISAGYEYSNIGRGVFVEGGVKLQILKK